MLNHPRPNGLGDRGQFLRASGCEDLSIVWIHVEVHDIDPICAKQDNYRSTQKTLTGISAGNASLLIRTSLLIKFIAAVLHSRASIRK
jgi:hypothetical protein